MIADPDLRQSLTAAIAVAAAEASPPEAAMLLAGKIQPGAIQNRAAVAIVQRWAQQSPPDAASWVAQFPDSPVRTAAMLDLFAIWQRFDAGAAETWRSGLAPGSF
jgi:hypothetical protein